ncbi:MAG TPA: TetR/AcrR family transcriptional regulator [Acidimicrobiales bacterium]|nr:TetR/AcrR family transcriptional regulator [Acidimicrobiales bacterium]
MAADTRQRIVEEATKLFGTNGFAGTSVAELEKAAGLKPGAGGLYAHFTSKEAVLAAVVDHCVTVADSAYAMHAALPLDDLKSELTVLVRGSLLLFDATEDWIRLRAKEGDTFPELFGGSSDLSTRAYRYLADWLASKVEAGVLAEHDTEAVADVLFGAIGNYWQQTKLFGRLPNDVGQDRFVAAWVDLALRLAG